MNDYILIKIIIKKRKKQNDVVSGPDVCLFGYTIRFCVFGGGRLMRNTDLYLNEIGYKNTTNQTKKSATTKFVLKTIFLSAIFEIIII